jgi:HEAT repeat protein
LDENTPNEVLAVQALIDCFDDTDYVFRVDPVLETVPTFAIYAEAAASFGACAVDPLIEALGGSRQSRVAAAIGLEACGPLAIKARPELLKMFENDGRDSILACAIIRGIGPGAKEFVPQLTISLQADDFHVQYWACRALSSIGPDASPAAGALIEALHTGVASVRRNAAIALGNIAVNFDGKSKWAVIQALRQTQKDYSAPVRGAAKEALHKLGANSTKGKVA